MAHGNQKPIDREVDKNGCHICTSHRGDYFGYPKVRREGKEQRIHRYVFEREYGPIPSRMCVLHSCDNPHCINPDHLFLGTRTDNNADREKKSRGAYGSRNGQAKLTEEQVLAIFPSQKNTVELGRDYGVVPSSIGGIKRGRNWGRLTGGKNEI